MPGSTRVSASRADAAPGLGAGLPAARGGVRRPWATWLPAAGIALWVLVAAAGPWLPLAPDRVDLPRVLAPPALGDSARDWLGYDALGRPVLDRLAAGAATSLLVAGTVVGIALVVGTLAGALSGYAGGAVDHVVVRIVDVFLAFPGILLAIALSGVLGPGIDNVVIALVVVGWVGFARLARAQTLSLKHRTYVVAAVATGAGPWRILTRHLLPQLAAPLTIEATFGIAGAVIAEAGLSFLGLGVQPPQASWGAMLLEGTRYFLVAPHLVVAPAATIFAVVLAVNLLGDALRDRLDVRNPRRGRRRPRR